MRSDSLSIYKFAAICIGEGTPSSSKERFSRPFEKKNLHRFARPRNRSKGDAVTRGRVLPLLNDPRTCEHPLPNRFVCDIAQYVSPIPPMHTLTHPPTCSPIHQSTCRTPTPVKRRHNTMGTSTPSPQRLNDMRIPSPQQLCDMPDATATSKVCLWLCRYVHENGVTRMCVCH